jgi:hypothetical protein
MAYKAPKPAKSETCCAFFVGILLIAKWLCDGYVENWLIAKILAISEMVLGNFAISEIISLIASFFGPEVRKKQFSTFHLNPKQPNAP